jgi:RNA polymerase sigma factor (sigma-70 family)
MGTIHPIRRVEGTVAELSDESLLLAVADDDQAALGALFDRFHRDVYAFLSRMTGASHDELDDLVQSAFLEVHRAASKFERRSAVKTWIFGIAVNVARHHARGEGRRRAAHQRWAEDAPAAAPRPDAVSERAQLLERLAQAVDELPYDHRIAYVMCVVEEVPCKEAALALGLREGTLWRRLHEARARVRAAMERLCP